MWWTCKFWAHQQPQCVHPICRLCWTWRTRGPAPHKRWRRTRGQSAPFHVTTHTVQRGSAALQYTQLECKLERVFSCGFDVEDGHKSKTCPSPWQRANHQGGVERNNASQYIAAGYFVCTKVMHKS
jgi:hypothetical protein